MAFDPFRLTLSEIIDLDTEGAFDDALRMLHDEEHESDDPRHLGLFDELVVHTARTPTLDDTIVVPFLVRFVWEKPFPNYTLGAWRALRNIVSDGEALEDVAWEILQHHPHGELRAELLATHSVQHSGYLESERILRLVARLRTSDPAPRVRVNAIELLDFLGSDPADSEAETLMQLVADDPAMEVRTCAFEVLSQLRLDEDSGARRRAVQEAALHNPDNRYAAVEMLSAYLRTGGIYTDTDRAAFALSLIAREREHPFYRELIGVVGWQVPGGGGLSGYVERFWLDDAPFESGAQLVQHWQCVFEDPAAPIEKRCHALVCLTTSNVRRINGLEEAALTFYFDQAHTPASLAHFTSATALMRVFFLFPRSPGTHAKSRPELFCAMLAHARKFESAEELAACCDARRSLVERIVETALRLRETDPERAELLSLAITAVKEDTNDLSYGLIRLRDADTAVNMTPLGELLATTEDSARAYGIAKIVAERYAKTFDGSALEACLVALSSAKWPNVITGTLNALPPMDRLEHRPQDVRALSEALKALRVDVSDEWRLEKITRWLKDEP